MGRHGSFGYSPGSPALHYCLECMAVCFVTFISPCDFPDTPLSYRPRLYSPMYPVPLGQCSPQTNDTRSPGTKRISSPAVSSHHPPARFQSSELSANPTRSLPQSGAKKLTSGLRAEKAAKEKDKRKRKVQIILFKTFTTSITSSYRNNTDIPQFWGSSFCSSGQVFHVPKAIYRYKRTAFPLQ